MFVIRPITLQDLDTLEMFAHATQTGMLSLPRNRRLLKREIQASMKSFQKSVRHPHDEIYLFVLEDIETGTVGGSCGLHAKSGTRRPLYFFRVEPPDAPAKNGTDDHRLLYPMTLHNGPTELCALYLTPTWRKRHLGRLLSFSRLLFIAGNRRRFNKTVIAALRGVIKGSTSPFWEGLGKHFMDLTLEEAIALGHSSEEWIAKRLPRYPIYASLLSKEVQKVMGKANAASQPALKMLLDEGFQLSSWIDMFDGGPVVTAPKKSIHTIKAGRLATVEAITSDQIHSPRWIMSNNDLNFRACSGKLKIVKKARVVINENAADALHIKRGEQIRYAPLP
ncbi:MAG: arginine N-succinyltransferase [Waddliaceae bacterium]